MSSKYQEKFIKTILDKSQSNIWEDAVNEWQIIDCEEDEFRESSCICGKEDLYYIFTIENIYNHNIISPIGSSCIRKFNRMELNDQTNISINLFKLYHAVENDEYISLDNEYFSRKILHYLYKDGAFDCEFNGFNGEVDYHFMLDMFNKKYKNEITIRQRKKINAIILNNIKPYLQKKLNDKILRERR